MRMSKSATMIRPLVTTKKSRTANKAQETGKIILYKKGMFGHVYFGQRDSITSIVKLLNRKTKQDCKF